MEIEIKTQAEIGRTFNMAIALSYQNIKDNNLSEIGKEFEESESATKEWVSINSMKRLIKENHCLDVNTLRKYLLDELSKDKEKI